MRSFLDKLLEYYGITLDEYEELSKEVTFSDIPDLSFFDNGEVSKNCFVKHVKNGDKIAVYGDYDADGIMATSILIYTFKLIKYTNYFYHIPTREEDGYGITKEFVDECLSEGVKLIITVDNGICAKDQINYAISNGIDVIIADHHEFEDNQIPSTSYIIHPAFSKEPKVICSGGFTSYILATSLIDRENPYILSLAGISLITDMMAMVGYNRKTVKLAINFINQYKFAPIYYLNDYNYVDEQSISSTIGPKINSYGRMISDRSINEIVEFFLSKNHTLLEERGEKINGINLQRKEKSNLSYDLSEFENENANILMLDIPEGIIGLAANKMLNINQKLTIVFSSKEDENGLIKGSGRSKDGISLLEFFEQNHDIIFNAGGHNLAGGLSIKKSDFNELKLRLFDFTRGKSFTEPQKKYIKINETEITYENYKILSNFGPFGEKNKKPEFYVSDFPVRSLNYSKNGLHIYTKINKDGTIIMFNYNPNDLKDKTVISFEGTFAVNYFRDVFSTKFVISKIY